MEERNIQNAADFLKELAEKALEESVEVTYREGAFFIHGIGEDGTMMELKPKDSDELIRCVNEGTEEMKEQLKERFFEALRASKEARPKTRLMTDGKYEEVREFLILRPLNYEMVREELEEIPHLVLGDITLVLYMVMLNQAKDYLTTRVKRELLQKWGISEAEVIRNALHNTRRLYPLRILTIEELLEWGPNQSIEKGIEQIRKGCIGYVLTNTMQINGAVSIFYPDAAKRISEAIENDFYIAFTSIHEAQLHTAEMIDPEVVRNSLYDTNRHCNRKEEVLTDSVYLYCRKSGKFQRMVHGRFQEEECWLEGPSGRVSFELAG